MMSRLRRAIAFLVLVTVCGCSVWNTNAEGLEQWNQYPLYTCCNLRPSNHEISDANWYQSDGNVPFGTPVTVADIRAKSFTIRSADGDFTVSRDYGTEDLGTYMQKLLVRQDPKQVVSALPEPIQDAIFEGRVVRGMTKEQVLIAIGYPPTHRTPGISANEWTYWANRWRTYKLQFDREGRLTRAWGKLPGSFGELSE